MVRNLGNTLELVQDVAETDMTYSSDHYVNFFIDEESSLLITDVISRLALPVLSLTA